MPCRGRSTSTSRTSPDAATASLKWACESPCRSCFFFNNPATTEIYTLSLHDALPISAPDRLQRAAGAGLHRRAVRHHRGDRKSTRLNSSHVEISYAVFCLKKKKKHKPEQSLENQNKE